MQEKVLLNVSRIGAMESPAKPIDRIKCSLPTALQSRTTLSRCHLFFHRRFPAERQSFKWKWNIGSQCKLSTRKHGWTAVGVGEELTLATSARRAETIFSNEHMLRNTKGFADDQLWGKTIFLRDLRKNFWCLCSGETDNFAIAKDPTNHRIWAGGRQQQQWRRRNWKTKFMSTLW